MHSVCTKGVGTYLSSNDDTNDSQKWALKYGMDFLWIIAVIVSDILPEPNAKKIYGLLGNYVTLRPHPPV